MAFIIFIFHTYISTVAFAYGINKLKHLALKKFCREFRTNFVCINNWFGVVHFSQFLYIFLCCRCDFRCDGFNNSMKKCARSVTTLPTFTIIRNLDYFEALRLNLVFNIDKSVNRSSFPIHFSRSNGIW